MKQELVDAFKYFWESATGVTADNKARIIRILCFALLLAGIVWAVWNHRAGVLSEDESDMGDRELQMRVQRLSAMRETETLKKIADEAHMVIAARKGSAFLADSMSGMNRRLFNLDGLEEIHGTGVPLEAQIQQEVHEVIVRAVMLAGSSRMAVVDAGDNKGLIIRQGQELPYGIGRVVRIKSDGLTVRNSNTKQEVEYMIK